MEPLQAEVPVPEAECPIAALMDVAEGLGSYTINMVPPTTLRLTDPDIEQFNPHNWDRNLAMRALELDPHPIYVRDDRVVSGTRKVEAAIFLNIELVMVRRLDHADS